MPEFAYFTRLPPEIRNHVYELLLVSKDHIKINSPRNRRKKVPPHTNFGRLLRVSKQINAEAKTVFYALNTFVIGNGTWASRSQVNLHALKTFTSRVPKDCIALITKIHVEMYFMVRRYSGPSHHSVQVIMYSSAARELQTVTRSVLKYFTGVESIDIFTCSLNDIIHSDPHDSTARMYGRRDDAVKAVRNLRDHPILKKIQFRDENFVEFGSFVDILNEGKEEKQHAITCIPFKKAQ